DENAGRVLHVADRNLLVHTLGIVVSAAQPLKHVRVIGAAGDRLLEDRRIRRHAPQPILIDQPTEVAARDQAASDVVEPDRLAVLLKADEWIGDDAHY